MKNKTKAKILTGVMAVATLAPLPLMLLACDNGTTKPEEAKAQSTDITGLFDNDASATVQGTFTDSEWNGVAEKIKAALNARFESVGTGVKGVFRNIFTQEGGIIIIVEKTSEYECYKTTGDGKTVYINFDILNNATVMAEAIGGILVQLNNKTAEIVKMAPPVPKYNRAMQLRGDAGVPVTTFT